MSDLSSAVVHLTMRFDNQVLSTGSGVFYKKDDQFYVVTAWHNVSGRHTETMQCLDQKNNAIPNNILVSFKFHLFGQFSRMCIKLPLFDDNKALYYIHPDNWPRVDVVAIPFDVNAPQIMPIKLHLDASKSEISISLFQNDKCCIHAIQDYLVSAEMAKQWMNSVNVTDEVFIPGYPHNITDNFLSPVWKRATISTVPSFNWMDSRTFLIDSASSSGMSGASVFYYNNQGIVTIGSKKFYLGHAAAIHAGIYVGRIKVTEKGDPQVGTVWHVSVIDEIIDGATFDFHPDEVEMKDQEIKVFINENLKKLNAQGIANILNKDMPSRYYVHNEITKAIKGRAKPDELMALILDVTKNYDGPLVEDRP